ncbi:hypothetical protein KTS45_14280 [Halomicroarcula limicola]|uniref:Uncharacterized protein n=1 Tax=Haloarcula limicola TaxID=1429915 RepID=A0A8J7Y6C1_9EURY|nr:hypothetical protein [Halomicroarcula limicola]MBV0925370.1 hypothetical protein [Halomicroarcula limicola]
MLGERGRTSEAVAEDAVAQFRTCHATGAPVDPHTADQPQVYLPLAGGRVPMPSETVRVRANVELLDALGSDAGG